MPLTKKGETVKRALDKEYSDRGENVLYAMINSGKLKGAEKAKPKAKGGKR
jgi:hypothetical protein